MTFSWLLVTVVISLPGLVDADDSAVSMDQDDVFLWKAAAVDTFFHNGELFKSSTGQEDTNGLKRFMDGSRGATRKSLADAIDSQNLIVEIYRSIVAERTDDKQGLSKAFNRSKLNVILKALVGEEPSLKGIMDSDPPGGVMDYVDKLRDREIALHIGTIYLNLIKTEVARQVEDQYREILGERRLPDDVVYFDKTSDEVGVPVASRGGARYPISGALARISYSGKEILRDVVVVTRAKMKPPTTKGEASRAFFTTLNQAFGVSAERTKAANEYMYTAQLMHSTPQAAVAYVALLEPGDVLYVPLYAREFFWDVEEAKVSLYSSQGAILDKLLMVGGPENDLSLPARQRKAKAKKSQGQRVGPKFERAKITDKVELALRPSPEGSEPATFDTCIPVGESFLAIGPKVAVDTKQPLLAVAKNSKHYVALGVRRNTGYGLVLIPRTAVSKAVTTDERSDEQKATDKEIADKVKNNKKKAAVRMRSR